MSPFVHPLGAAHKLAEAYSQYSDGRYPFYLEMAEEALGKLGIKLDHTALWELNQERWKVRGKRHCNRTPNRGAPLKFGYRFKCVTDPSDYFDRVMSPDIEPPSVGVETSHFDDEPSVFRYATPFRRDALEILKFCRRVHDKIELEVTTRSEG